MNTKSIKEVTAHTGISLSNFIALAVLLSGIIGSYNVLQTQVTVNTAELQNLKELESIQLKNLSDAIHRLDRRMGKYEEFRLRTRRSTRTPIPRP